MTTWRTSLRRLKLSEEQVTNVNNNTGCGVFAAVIVLIFWATTMVNDCRANPPTIRIEVKSVP